MRTRTWRAAPALLVALAGCGGGPALGEVSGTVRVKGKPTPGLRVYFNPDVTEPGQSNPGASSHAVTDADGRYALTYADPKDPRSGAVIGSHVVVVNDPDAEDQSKRVQVSRVALRYSRVTETPLRRDVKAGTQTIDLDLE